MLAYALRVVMSWLRVYSAEPTVLKQPHNGHCQVLFGKVGLRQKLVDGFLLPHSPVVTCWLVLCDPIGIFPKCSLFTLAVHLRGRGNQ